MSKLLVVLVMVAVAGCSNKAIYENLGLDQRNQCAKEPPPTYSECIERTSQTYEEYARERKEMSETQRRVTERRSATL